MKRLAATSAFLTALCLPALADPDNGNGNKYGWDNPNNPHYSGTGNGKGVSGVPGPLLGAGLPVIAVGFGAYWLVRRYRRKSDKPAP
jgi:hypothetical protein